MKLWATVAVVVTVVALLSVFVSNWQECRATHSWLYCFSQEVK